MSDHRLAFGEFRFDPWTGDLHGTSGLVPLKPKTLALLGYLVTHPGRLVSKQELLDALWPDVFVSDSVLKVYVREIRQVLGDDVHAPRFIETAHRRGYRFIAPVREVPASSSPDSVSQGSLRDALEGTPPADLHNGSNGPSVRVHYARSGSVNIAYQVLGNGPVDLVFVMGWVSHLEYYWREPSFARFLQRLASFSRLILFDKRGTGLSDPVIHVPTLEQRMDDVRAALRSRSRAGASDAPMYSG
jgi:DNA-binding winged helix-turn-helix (wHTH) protein